MCIRDRYDRASKLLKARGAYEEAKLVEEISQIKDSPHKFGSMKEIVSRTRNAEELVKHVEVLERYLDIVKSIGADVVVEPAFARGITYYTGIIFEVVVPGFPVSIAGGGRYDDLTRVYGGESLATTGFAIGVERTMLALTKDNTSLPFSRGRQVLVLLLVDDIQTYPKIYSIVRDLRRRGLIVQFELISPSKLSKWLEYASKNFIDYIVIVGKKELELGAATVRDMRGWSQRIVKLDEISKILATGV